jgi:hypothetical protein
MAASRAAIVLDWWCATLIDVFSSWSKRAWKVTASTVVEGFFFFFQIVVWTCLLTLSEESMSGNPSPSNLVLLRGKPTAAFLFSVTLRVTGPVLGGVQGES